MRVLDIFITIFGINLLVQTFSVWVVRNILTQVKRNLAYVKCQSVCGIIARFLFNTKLSPKNATKVAALFVIMTVEVGDNFM